MGKSFFLCLLALLLALSGCAAPAPEETHPVQTIPTETAPAEETQTEPPLPETVDAIAQVDGVWAVLESRNRGDRVQIVDQFDDTFYVLKTEAGYGLAEKALIRPDAQEEYNPWTGYAKDQAPIYDHHRCFRSVNFLAAGTPVEILEDLGRCYLIQYGNTLGYMTQDSLQGKAPAGSSGNSKKETGPDTGKDGGDISLTFQAEIHLLSTSLPQEGSVTGEGTVLANDTQVILGWFDRGDAVPLVADGSFDAAEGWYPVYWNGIFAQVPQDQVRMAEEAPYENWIGGSLKTLSLYADHWLQGDPLYQVDGRTQVQILYELEHCYLVEAGDMTGYAAKEQILPWEELPQSSQIGNSGSATAPETAPTEPIPETTAPEWTPPKL